MAQISYSTTLVTESDVTAEDVVAAARSYIGIPYVHQGRDRHGTDCGGLILMVGNDLHLTDLKVLGYSNSPDGRTFGELLDSHLVRIADKEDLMPGDILACDYGEGIQHTAFFVRDDGCRRYMVVHAKRAWGVVEQYLHGVDKRGWVRTYRVKHLYEAGLE